MNTYKPCAVFPQYFECPVTDPIHCNSRTRCEWYKGLLKFNALLIDSWYMGSYLVHKMVYMYYSLARVNRIPYRELSTRDSEDLGRNRWHIRRRSEFP